MGLENFWNPPYDGSTSLQFFLSLFESSTHSTNFFMMAVSSSIVMSVPTNFAFMASEHLAKDIVEAVLDTVLTLGR